MSDKNSIESFLEIIRSQFNEVTRLSITEITDLKSLDEWSSLQTMIIVNEIDKNYGVVLTFDEIKNGNTVRKLYKTVKNKIT